MFGTDSALILGRSVSEIPSRLFVWLLESCTTQCPTEILHVSFHASHETTLPVPLEAQQEVLSLSPPQILLVVPSSYRSNSSYRLPTSSFYPFVASGPSKLVDYPIRLSFKLSLSAMTSSTSPTSLTCSHTRPAVAGKAMPHSQGACRAYRPDERQVQK